MFKFIILNIILSFALILINADKIEDIPSLPYCPDKNGSGLVLVSTLDGNLSAVNSTGSLIWQINTGPGPLLHSNIHNLELTNNGEWIRIIPSLTGTLYKFDGTTIDPIPITAENLLKSSFRYSDDLVIAGGIEVRTYGIGFRTGKLLYECTSLKCSNNEQQEVDDILLLERTTHTIRAVEPSSGTERWNFSVGLHNVKLPRVSCIDSSLKLFDWNLTAILPEGKLKASTIHNNVEHSWQYTFTSPIVRVWRWSGKNLTEVNLFSAKNIPNVVTTPFLPSIYIGMHNKQLYIHESVNMQNILQRKSNNELVVAESKSIAKIPWKPIPASTVITEDDSTALSVLNLSEYVNGNGYYLYTEADLKQKDTILCDTNNSFIEDLPSEEIMADFTGAYLYMFLWWKECLLLMVSFLACRYLFYYWHQHHYNPPKIALVEKPIEAAPVTTERQISEKENETFSSRYVNDFETVSCLGKGGFGLVFEVKAKIDECSYAIKRITLPNEQKERERVMREVKTLAKLDHKNIVRYFCSWVECPPLGWQQEHDQKWIGDRSSLMSDETATSPSHYVRKSKRSKSASISIDIPIKKYEISSTFENEQNEEDSDDDSFIVFEKTRENSASDSFHITFENTSKGVESRSNTSSGIELNHTSNLSEHLGKKINWKRPGRRHHSWDLTQNNFKPKEPPVFLYIQMQLCQKESLKEWLSSNQHRDYKYIIDVFSQILDAVEYVHLSGLIHRDLKPSNIFFALDGQIKVGDFGLVKDMEDAFDLELIKKGSSPSYRGHTVEVGTQLYMSPEQFQSRIYDYKVDIYSLGLIFFELLVPFSTDMERFKTLTDVKNHKYPEHFAEKYPNEYALLENMLCKNPNKRLTTIGIKARPPFNREDTVYGKDCHYRLNTFQKN